MSAIIWMVFLLAPRADYQSVPGITAEDWAQLTCGGVDRLAHLFPPPRTSGSPVRDVSEILLALILVALMKILAVLIFAVICTCIVLLGLPTGHVVLRILGKKRHLFWALPLFNFALFLLLIAAVWPAFGGQSRFPEVELTTEAFLLLTFLGWISAGIVIGIKGATARLNGLRAARRGSTADGDHFVRDYLGRPQALSKRAAFLEGLAASWHGLVYLRLHCRLWWYAVIPILLNILITGLVLVFFLAVVIGYAVYLHPLFPAGWGWLLLEALCVLLLLLLAAGGALGVWMLLQAVLCGHYYQKLARQVELKLGTRPEDMKELSLGKRVADALLDLAVLAAVNLGFLLLHVVPVLGSIVAVAGSLGFDWYIFGAQYFDFPLSLRGQRRNQRRAFSHRFRAQTLGLGAVVFLATLLPVVGSVALATAVVGAVLLHQRLRFPAARAGGGQVLRGFGQSAVLLRKNGEAQGEKQ